MSNLLVQNIKHTNGTTAQTVDVDTTIEATENATATGPLTVSSGITITVNSGGNLAII